MQSSITVRMGRFISHFIRTIKTLLSELMIQELESIKKTSHICLIVFIKLTDLDLSLAVEMVLVYRLRKRSFRFIMAQSISSAKRGLAQHFLSVCQFNKNFLEKMS